MNFSVIFDMDGVIINSNPYHKMAWKQFFAKHNITITDEELEKKVFGRTGNEGLAYLLGGNLKKEEVEAYLNEIDGNFRKFIAPNIKPMKGLEELLKELTYNKIKCAVATSAPEENVRLIMSETGLEKYFDVIVDKTFVTKGKPDPEIYLKAAELINAKPEECIVLEDSLSGIKAALNAGMRVIGVTTTHGKEELAHTDYTIDDFTGLDFMKLKTIMAK